jgi:hypothetical protein
MPSSVNLCFIKILKECPHFGATLYTALDVWEKMPAVSFVYKLCLHEAWKEPTSLRWGGHILQLLVGKFSPSFTITNRGHSLKSSDAHPQWYFLTLRQFLYYQPHTIWKVQLSIQNDWASFRWECQWWFSPPPSFTITNLTRLEKFGCASTIIELLRWECHDDSAVLRLPTWHSLKSS